MKTPRQILLEQHQSAESRLERMQRDVIASSLKNRAQRLGVRPSSAALSSICQKLWAELVLPARRIWFTYAFIWVAIAAFYIANADHVTTRTAEMTNQTEAVANWKEQQIVLVELLKPTTTEPADRPKTQQMRPRSEANHIAIG
jgi:hypothetical protein